MDSLHITLTLETLRTWYFHVNLEKIITLCSHKNLQKSVFLYKKYIRDYIQLYLQLYLSDVYSEHFFFYNIFFLKSKIILLILFKKRFSLFTAYLRKVFTNLIKLHKDAYLKRSKITCNNKSKINSTLFFLLEMSVALGKYVYI